MYEQDKRIVMTLDAGGTNFVFSAIQGCKEIISPIGIPAVADNLEGCLLTLVEGFDVVAYFGEPIRGDILVALVELGKSLCKVSYHLPLVVDDMGTLLVQLVECLYQCLERLCIIPIWIGHHRPYVVQELSNVGCWTKHLCLPSLWVVVEEH